MAKNNNNEKYAYLDQFSTEQLEELLQTDIESSNSSDTGVIFYILEVIAKREEDYPTRHLPDEEKAWKEFQQYYNIPEGNGLSLYPIEGERVTERDTHVQRAKVIRPHPAFKLTGLVAAIVVGIFGLMVTAQAVGIDVFGAIGRWTEETFHFVTSPRGAVYDGADVTPTPENLGYYNSLQAALKGCGITEDLVPKWYPEAVEEAELQIFRDDVSDCVNIYFSVGEENFLSIDITRYHSASDLLSLTFEKDGAFVEQYVSGAKIFYVLSNVDTITATWSDGLLVESIVSSLSIDEVKAIINSIGVI